MQAFGIHILNHSGRRTPASSPHLPLSAPQSEDPGIEIRRADTEFIDPGGQHVLSGLSLLDGLFNIVDDYAPCGHLGLLDASAYGERVGCEYATI